MIEYIVDGLIYRSPDTLNVLIEIGSSPGKGAGVFALRDILPHTLLLSERPLIQLSDDGSRHDPLDTLVNALPPPLKKAYRSLHGYQEVAAPPPRPLPSPSNSTTPSSPPRKRRAPPQRQSLNRRVLYSNGFATARTTTGVFEVASRINHSCVPNASYAWNEAVGRMEYVAVRKLLAGEEVTIDYGHTKGHLVKYYGFECDCGACTEWGSVSAATAVEEEMEGEDRLVMEGAVCGQVKMGEKVTERGEDGEHEKENLQPELQAACV